MWWMVGYPRLEAVSQDMVAGIVFGVILTVCLEIILSRNRVHNLNNEEEMKSTYVLLGSIVITVMEFAACVLTLKGLGY